MAAPVPLKDTVGNLRNYTTPRDAYNHLSQDDMTVLGASLVLSLGWHAAW